MTHFLIFLVSYLIGAIPSAVIVSKLQGTLDPRQHGSGNPGATNMLRLFGKKTAAIVLAADVFKGTFAVLLAHYLGAGPYALGLMLAATTLGHCYPVFSKFRGGKGVATCFGGLFALNMGLALLALAAFAAAIFLTRYVSLSSLISIGSAPVLTLLLGDPHYALGLLATVLLVAYRHQANIARLKAGTENRVNWRKQPTGNSPSSAQPAAAPAQDPKPTAPEPTQAADAKAQQATDKTAANKSAADKTD
jgi:glycerol-3-phosphate acyltransferase PlsY